MEYSNDTEMEMVEATNLATLSTALGAMVCISVPLVVHP